MKICRSNEKKQTIRFDTDPDRTAKAKKTKKKAAFLSVALSGAMIVGLFSAVFVVEPEKVSAATESLPGIEKIKTNLNNGAEVLNILEITDEEKNAVFGYSIEGQEPVDLVKDVLKTAVPGENQTGLAARRSAGDGYFWSLVSKELIYANSTKHQLTFTKEFNEYYPWDYANYDDLKELSLDTKETVNVTGSYEFSGDHKGSFTPTGNSYGVDASSGTYAQDIATYGGSFIPAEDIEDSKKDDYIFYIPEFVKFYVDADNEGKAHFYTKLNSETGEPEDEFTLNARNLDGKYVMTTTEDKDGNLVSYDYYGTFGETNRWERKTELDENGRRVLKPYYYLDSLMENDKLPKIGEKIDGECFALQISKVSLVSFEASYPYKRYFTFDPQGFEYVGEDSGNYNISVASVQNDTGYKKAEGIESGSINFYVIYDKEYYYCDVKNNNLFLKYVLDYDLNSSDEVLSRAASGIDVDVVKYTELSENANDAGQNYALLDYDLIVLQPGEGHFEFPYTREGDTIISPEADAFVEKLKAPALEGTAIIFSADRGDYGYKDEEHDAPHWLLTGRIIAEFIKQKYSKEDYVEGSDATSKKGLLAYPDGAGRWGTTDNRYNRGYVDGSLLFYKNDSNREVFLNNDLSDKIPEMYYSEGSAFDGVYEEIQYENYLRRTAGSTDLLSEDYIHLGTLIRYILNYKSKRQQTLKTSVKILEIEPTNRSELRVNGVAYPDGKDMNNKGAYTGDKDDLKSFVYDWFGGTYNDSTITLSTMSTYEFVGKIDDITEDFDLVYIGADITDFHKDANGATVFNDTGMNGLVYYNIGDFNFNNDVRTINGNKYNRAKGLIGNDSGNDNLLKVRYSGNDLTEKKLNELEAFADAGYPIIFADNLLKDKSSVEKTVNNERVDVNSRMYSFIKYVAGKDNTYRSTDASNSENTSKLMRQLSLSKPVIDFVEGGRPLDYGGMNNKNAISNRTLEFTFKILNETDPTPLSTTYSLHLYIDKGSDGIFSADDEIDIASYLTENGVSSSTRSLFGSHIYTLSRPLPDTIKGMVSWKLLVQVNGGKLHASKKGYAYTPVRVAGENENTGDPITINILQINPQKTRYTADTSDPVGTRDTYALDWQNTINWQNEQEKAIGEKAPFAKYFKDLKDEGDYILNITTVTPGEENDYYNNYHDEAYYAAPENAKYNINSGAYNMLIIGFGDAYGELVDKTAVAVNEFIDSGRAVLFSHDNTAPCNSKYVYDYDTSGGGHGYYFNTIIRDRVGLDRYGITDSETEFSYDAWNKYRLGGSGGVLYNSQSLTPKQRDDVEAAGYDIAYKPSSIDDDEGKTDPFVHGFTDLYLEGMNPYTGSDSYRKYKYNGVSDSMIGNIYNYYTDIVTKENEGQITKYPYNIEGDVTDTEEGFAPNYDSFGGGREFIKVSDTHLQYYQMNMMADDLIVWYCLGHASSKSDNDLYSFVPNDVANQYYIFTRGNITYSGCGHSAVDNNARWKDPTAKEAMLFINTMIAAYRAGYSDPKFEFVSGEGENAVPVENLYLPGESVGSERTVGQDIDYSTSNYAGGKITFRFNDTNTSPNKKLTLENMKIEFENEFTDTIVFQNKIVNATFKNYWFTIDKDGHVVVPHIQNKNDGYYEQEEKVVDGRTYVTCVVTYYPDRPNENMDYSAVSTEKITFIDENGNPVENGNFISGKTYSIDMDELSRILYDTAFIQDGTYVSPKHISPNFTFKVTPMITISGVSVTGKEATLNVGTLKMFDIG